MFYEVSSGEIAGITISYNKMYLQKIKSSVILYKYHFSANKQCLIIERMEGVSLSYVRKSLLSLNSSY